MIVHTFFQDRKISELQGLVNTYGCSYVSLDMGGGGILEVDLKGSHKYVSKRSEPVH